MKIAFRIEQMASFYIYMGLGRAFANLGHKIFFWNPEQNSAFDFFNEVEPDLYLGQGYNLVRAEIKCINNRPDMKVLLKVGIDGTILDEPNINDYEILKVSDKEKKDVGEIINPHRLFLFNYHIDKYDDYILGNWHESGYNIFALPPMGDKYAFYPEYKEDIKSDISFCGGYWEYKAKNLNRFIIPLCYPVGKYNIKIAGNQIWPVPQYIGVINDNTIRQLISSSKIYPVIHELQSTDFGYEILSRLYNGILCKSLVISDYVEAINELFPNNEIPMFKEPKEYYECIDYYLNNEQDRLDLIEKQHNSVINNYTYDHLVPKILEMLNG